MPTPMPITTDTTMVRAASSSVTGKRRANSSQMGWRVQYERPKSPCRTMFPIHSRYWTCTGRSSPRSLRSASIVGAWAMRRSTYCFMRPRLLLDPREGQAAPEVVPVVVLEAFDVRRMRDVARRHRHVDVVRFVGQVALDLVDDL